MLFLSPLGIQWEESYIDAMLWQLGGDSLGNSCRAGLMSRADISPSDRISSGPPVGIELEVKPLILARTRSRVGYWVLVVT